MPPHQWERGAQCFQVVCRYAWRDFVQILQSCRLRLKDKRWSALIWDFGDDGSRSQGFWDAIRPTFVNEMSRECWEGFFFKFRDRIWKVRPLWGEEGEPEEVLFKAMCWLFHPPSACIGLWSSNIAACWDLNTSGLFSSGLGWTVDVLSSNLWTTSLKTHFSLWDSVTIFPVWSGI